MKLKLSHPTGNANVKFALNGLYHAGLLDSFHTSIASYPNNIWGKLSEIKGFAEFNRRSFTPEIAPVTNIHPFKEIGRILSMRLHLEWLIAHESGFFCIDKVYEYIDKCVANSLLQTKIDAIYAYEDGALHSFRAAKPRKINCLYDLPIGYWRAGKNFLKEEITNRPEWASTLGGFKDSERKLKRKDEELALADHIFVASSFTKATLAFYPEQLAEISVIPYGFPQVNLNRQYNDATKRKLKLLFVGGLSQRKGVANVLEAVAGFENDVELTIIGQKSTNDCHPLNEGLKQHNWIPSLPHSEILTQMSEHDVFLFPSLFEGFGLVITEAMSQGTPVITTNRTIGADIIKHGSNGWLVEPGRTSDIVSIIGNLLNNPTELIKVGMNAMQTAAARPWVKYGEELSDRIEHLI